MTSAISIGKQDFASLRENHYFYVDKTDFIRQWWESGDDITLITRPRRFGKTLNMSMLNCFFSRQYAEKVPSLKGFPSGNRKIPQTAGNLSGDFSELCGRKTE